MADIDAQIANLQAIRATLPTDAIDAVRGIDDTIAALRARQRIEASDGGSVSDAQQASAGGDLRDNALGSGAMVLHDITIAAGGALVVGATPADLPPGPAAIQRALTTHLRTLLERYQHLSLQGLGAGGTQQMRIGLRAVFVNLRTNVTIGATGALFDTDGELHRQPARPDRGTEPTVPLDPELQQWLSELLTEDERNLLSLNEQPPRQRAVARPTPGDEPLERIKQRLLAPRAAIELIRHYPALVLLGDPGSGKTTVLRHLALGFAHARLNADQPERAALDPELAWAGALPLPILVQLRRFADDLIAPPTDAGPLLDHIERVLSNDRLTALAGHLQSRLEAGAVLLLLDGLDEVADDTHRAWVAQAVTLFQSRFSGSRVVLTSRTYAYREPCLLAAPFQVATLQPLDRAAQNDFIARWYRAALLTGSELAQGEQDEHAQRRAHALSEALDRRARLREVSASPLLLTMIALLHLNGLGLPQQRAELYQACLLLLLEQWEQRRADGGPAGLAAALGLPDRLTTTGERLALIQPIAFQLQTLGREEARHAEVRQWLLDRFLDLAGDDGKRAKALIDTFLAFLEGRSGLLIARDLKDRYAFPHKTFQEYLAARELIYQGATETLKQALAHRHDPTWREVILLTAGHLVSNSQPQPAKEIAWQLLDADPPGSAAYYRSAVLAGEIVEELGDSLGRDGRKLRDDIVQALVELVQSGQLAAKERVDAAFLLGRLGDPRLPTPDQPAYWCIVAAGSFWHGDDRENKPLRQVAITHDYQIARYPITNAEYQRFIDAGGYATPQWWTPEGWKYRERQDWTLPRYWDDATYNGPAQPVVGVSWYEAAAYCNWLTELGHHQGWLLESDTIRLPTWLEWERAARGTDQRRYPWGADKPDVERANYAATGIGRPAPVGCFPTGAAACGAQDMAGNVLEWTATPYQQPTALVPGKDFTQSEGIALSWSSFYSGEEHLCCGARVRYNPFFRNSYLGFRVVLSRALIV
jgi:formylglycine-generating enzyme required for sulfatase activity